MRIALATSGCKLNQAETELLARQFAGAGHRLVSQPEEADVYILNTCTVTHVADSKARRLLRMAHRRNPNALIVATGCYAQRAPGELKGIDGVRLVVGNKDKTNLIRLLEESGVTSKTATADVESDNQYSAFRTRSFVKVQDGCSNYCSYCIVPTVRGRERSMPTEEVVREVRQRVSEGYKEVVLTGTKIGAYEYDGAGLKDLLERILTETGVDRLRLSSLQPQEISRGLLGMWGNSRLCPHFHLSLQSGSDGVLKRMRRRYRAGDYKEAVSLIRTMVPDAAITTDVICGFPGESDEEFEESYRFCREMGFARIHVFAYSARSGTEAARLPQQINSKIKKQRSEKMLALAEESARDFREGFAGKTMAVLWEKKSGAGVWEGYTANYIKTYTRSDDDLSNKLLTLKLA